MEINNKQDIESIYKRKSFFAEDIKIKKAQSSYEKGEYNTFLDAYNNTANPNVFSVVKRIVFKKPLSKNEELKELTGAMDYIVRNIMNLTPIQFYSIYSIENLKKYSLFIPILKIAELADIETRKECMFDTKLTFFKTTWAEDFKDMTIDGKTVFFADENIKSGLKKAGDTRGLEKAKDSDSLEKLEKKNMGKIVDEILMTAINDVMFDDKDFQNAKEIYQFLTEESSKYFEKGGNYAGICDIIAARQYPSLLDFYYMNCPVKFQEDTIEAYEYYRRNSKIPKHEFIETCIDLKMKQMGLKKDEQEPYEDDYTR